MIDLYTASTPNGFKISIALEELALPYAVHLVDIRAGDQFKAEFSRISPNNKIPAIVDDDGPGGRELTVFESGAILVYLAEKTGRLLAASGSARYAALEWLFFQVGGTGPMLGQAHHFRSYAPEKIPYAIERYTNEAKRLYGVLDRRLSQVQYLAGEEYTIADVANLPWLLSHERQGVNIAEFGHVGRWMTELRARPAVARGLAVPPKHGSGAQNSASKLSVPK
ncbi:MAG: glutathione binding-like protein [Myxococcota bacterium]|nr:glutathione binding-like protein [Myxococcota bacterium]